VQIRAPFARRAAPFARFRSRGYAPVLQDSTEVLFAQHARDGAMPAFFANIFPPARREAMPPPTTTCLFRAEADAFSPSRAAPCFFAFAILIEPLFAILL